MDNNKNSDLNYIVSRDDLLIKIIIELREIKEELKKGKSNNEKA